MGKDIGIVEAKGKAAAPGVLRLRVEVAKGHSFLPNVDIDVSGLDGLQTKARDLIAALPKIVSGALAIAAGRDGCKAEDIKPIGVAFAEGVSKRFRVLGLYRSKSEGTWEETIEAVVASGRRFDIVLAMEVVEHVADVEAFVAACCAAVKPDGLLVMATLNRTLKSYALAIVGAEYVLRWLPKGTHDWEKFVTPAELGGAIEGNGFTVGTQTGVVFNPLTGRWSASRDMDVNYMLAACRGGAA